MINFSIKKFLKDMEGLFIFCPEPSFPNIHVILMCLHKKGENCTIMSQIWMTHTTNVHKDIVSDSLSNYLMISHDTGVRVRKTQHCKNMKFLKLTCKYNQNIKCAEICEDVLKGKKKNV